MAFGILMMMMTGHIDFGPTKKMKQSFTLVELIIIVVIVGIIATFGMPAWRNAQLKAEDREAQAMLRMIKAAENVVKLESNSYIACGSTTDCNTKLRLDILPTGKWGYSVTSAAGSGKFCAQATGGGTDSWYIDEIMNDPEQSGDCTYSPL